MKSESEHEVMMIPVQSVRIANPRVRDRRKFELIIRSISEQGLKRPITVTEASRVRQEEDRWRFAAGPPGSRGERRHLGAKLSGR
jgi:hypothetical protein